ncbi:MAG: thiol reductant ABC exporter subunit CydC [Anaerolineales bacterium]|nr:thiol reductant ABC exporter subunit CydC [Anaerolineales bacterium]
MKHPLWRLLQLIAPFAPWMALAALLGLATVGSSIGLMATSAYIIAKAALHPSVAELQLAIVGVRFFGLSRGLSRYLERYVSHHVTFKLLARLRVWFYEQIEPLAPARLMSYRSGDLLSRIVSDIDTLEHFFVQVIAPPVVALFTALLVGLLLARYDWRLAVTALFFLGLAGLGLPWLSYHLTGNLGARLVAVRAELKVVLIDTLQGLADVLACGREHSQLAQVHRVSHTLTAIQARLAWLTGLHTALSGLLANLATVAILVVAIPLVRSGQVDGVYLGVFVLATLASFEAVFPLSAAFQNLEGSLAAARRLFDLVDVEPVIEDGPHPVTLSPKEGGGREADAPPRSLSMVVENLHFRYQPTEPPVLNGLNFNLPAGGRLAIMGPSGAGKSTLVHLLLRFWDYQAGRIELGGRDLRSFSPEEVRGLISVVSQQTHLFNTTVRENLLMARPDAATEEIVQAARQAHIHDFIESLPQGYETWLGEYGLRLSGGERQRLAIARAILKDAPLLILDEATTHLDAVVEREVRQALEPLLKGRTTLIITHRPSDLALADDVLLLETGQIVKCSVIHEVKQTEDARRNTF